MHVVLSAATRLTINLSGVRDKCDQPTGHRSKANEPTDKLLRLIIDTLSNLKVETRGE